MTKPVFGIDLGTTFSSIGYLTGNNPTIVTDASNSKAIPSVVCYADEYITCGQEAVNSIGDYADYVIYDTKRMLGRRFTGDEEIARLNKELPFTIRPDPRTDEVLIEIPASQTKSPMILRPFEVSAEVLKYMIALANETLEEDQQGYECVVTVPANWGERPREETKKAAKLAKLNIKQLVNEPTAAAVAYKELILGDKADDSKQTIIIFDFGGGTLDVSLMVMEGTNFDIQAVAGNPTLGGRDFDRLLMDWVIEKEKVRKSDLRPRDFDKIRKICCNAKCSLSRSPHTMMNFENINRKDFSIRITRDEFNSICKKLFDQILEPVKNVLKQKKMDKSQIDNIIMVGGSSFIPKAVQILKDFFGKAPVRFPDPQLAVVQGAAIIATKYSDLKMKNFSIQEVCSSTIGVKVLGGVMASVIPQGEKIPCSKDKTLYTTVINQKMVVFDIYEGEYQMAKYNKLITSFTLNEIPPGPPETPLNFHMSISEDGVLEASACCTQGGKTANIKVEKESNKYSLQELESRESKVKVTPEEDAEEARNSRIVGQLNVLYSNLITHLEDPAQSHLTNISSLKNELYSLVSNLSSSKTHSDNEVSQTKQTWRNKLSQAGHSSFPSWLY